MGPGTLGGVSLSPYDPDLRDRYLRRLGLPAVPVESRPPSAELLGALHRAHVGRVPYENLEIQLGRPTSIDPTESARRIVTGRGGYCFHLNGAFAGLLLSLGYEVDLVRAAVPSAGEDGRGWGSHLVLLVRLPEQVWVADVGLGDGMADPMPLVVGVVEQPPFRYEWERVGGSRWRFHHDPSASIGGFDLDVTPVPLSAFEPNHAELSTAPHSSFVQRLVVQQRRPDHALTLRGCVLTRADATGRTSRDVTKEAEWSALLREEFGLRLDVEAAALTALWERTRTSHEAWDRSGRP